MQIKKGGERGRREEECISVKTGCRTENLASNRSVSQSKGGGESSVQTSARKQTHTHSGWLAGWLRCVCVCVTGAVAVTALAYV